MCKDYYVDQELPDQSLCTQCKENHDKTINNLLNLIMCIDAKELAKYEGNPLRDLVLSIKCLINEKTSS